MPAPAVNKGAALRLFERESMALRTLANLMIEASRFETMMAPAPESTPSTTDPCVDGPRLARDNFACRTEVACSHVSGLFTQSGWTAGPDGVREPRPHHSNGIDVPVNRQASLGCVGSSLLSRKFQNVAQRPKLPRPRAGSSHAGASPPRRCARSCWLAPRRRPAAAAVDATRSPTDRHWSPSIAAN